MFVKQTLVVAKLLLKQHISSLQLEIWLWYAHGNTRSGSTLSDNNICNYGNMLLCLFMQCT